MMVLEQPLMRWMQVPKIFFQKALKQGIQRKVQTFAIEGAKLAELEAATTPEQVIPIIFTDRDTNTRFKN